MANPQPEVPYIKKIKKKSHGHHGGSWKVAFADFAVAMMAFFLLLWILNAATQEQRREISGFFERPDEYTPSSDSAPIIVLFDDVDQEMKDKLMQRDDIGVANTRDIEEILARREKSKLEELKQQVELKIQTTESLKEYKDQIHLDITKEGLRIQIFDDAKKAMFGRSSSMMNLYARNILEKLAEPINQVDNRISITGHTDANPFKSDELSNWELSTERANAARRALVSGGLRVKKIARIIGLGSTSLYDKRNPNSALNRRISIIVLNEKAEKAFKELEEVEQTEVERAREELIKQQEDPFESIEDSDDFEEDLEKPEPNSKPSPTVPSGHSHKFGETQEAASTHV